MSSARVKFLSAFARELKAVHGAARVSRRGCQQYFSSGINHNRPVAHACGRDRQDILRSCTDLGQGLARGVAKETPNLDGVEIVAESGGHPVLPRATCAHRLPRLNVKKQAAALFPAEVEPHQVLRHLDPPRKKRQANLNASYRNQSVDVQPSKLCAVAKLGIGK